MTESELSRYGGKEIRVICAEGMEFKGICTDFTQAIDNEPEEASIAVRTKENGLTEIYLHEIKIIEVLN
jgi:hypothetical protein